LKTWIALLRGVNVVGHGKVPMKELVAVMQRAGFGSVRTYIQSGNVVFHSSKGTARTLSIQIAQLIHKKFGFEPRVMLLTPRELAEAARVNPFPQADGDHKSLHLFFLSEHPRSPDLESLAKLKAGREAFVLGHGVFYLYTPDGFPDSAVAQKVERLLGVHATGRNWRTVNQLLGMVQTAGGPDGREARAKRGRAH
jgi:uncharacterized protein (DUF1697 family)